MEYSLHLQYMALGFALNSEEATYVNNRFGVGEFQASPVMKSREGRNLMVDLSCWTLAVSRLTYSGPSHGLIRACKATLFAIRLCILVHVLVRTFIMLYAIGNQGTDTFCIFIHCHAKERTSTGWIASCLVFGLQVWFAGLPCFGATTHVCMGKFYDRIDLHFLQTGRPVISI